MLEIDDSQVSEVNNELEADVKNQSDGDLSPAERDQRESSIAGGFRTALKATGLIALLSGLKPVTALLGAILGAISRFLVPVIEDIADFLRPVISFVNNVASNTGNAANTARNLTLGGLPSLLQGDLKGAVTSSTGAELFRLLKDQIEGGGGSNSSSPGNGSDGLISEFLTDPSKTADQSGEVTKAYIKNSVNDPVQERLGGGSTGQ
jgi:hypothetical protein